MTNLRTILALAVLLVLAACSFLPLPYEIDLAALIDDVAGEVEVEIGAGVTEAFTLLLPEEGERCHQLDHDRSGATIMYGQLRYELAAAYTGPEVSGEVELQPFLAASEEALWQHPLGAPIAVDLGESAASLTDRIALSDDQVDALNDGYGCVGVRLTGSDLRAEESGDATITYEVRELVLRVGVALY
jgi:hypothetical protein